MSESPVIGSKIKKRGSRQEVFDGLAAMTSGGLKKEDLILNEKTKKICSTKEVARGVELSKKMRDRKSCAEEARLQDTIEIVAPAPEVAAPKKRKSRAKKVAEPGQQEPAPKVEVEV